MCRLWKLCGRPTRLSKATRCGRRPGITCQTSASSTARRGARGARGRRPTISGESDIDVVSCSPGGNLDLDPRFLGRQARFVLELCQRIALVDRAVLPRWRILDESRDDRASCPPSFPGRQKTTFVLDVEQLLTPPL